MHQRAPEVHLLHPRPLGVEVLHAVPRAARARLGAEKTDPHAVKFVTSYDVCEEEKSKMAQGKLKKGPGARKSDAVARRKTNPKPSRRAVEVD